MLKYLNPPHAPRPFCFA